MAENRRRTKVIPAFSLIGAGRPVSFHNGSMVQCNPYFGQTGYDYLYLNALKSAQEWSFVDNSGPPVPDTLDSNGYPTSISNGGVYTIFGVPNATKRPGNWIVRWTGNGTIYGLAFNLVSGSLSGTNGRAVVAPTDPSWGSDSDFRVGLGISAIGSPRITSLAFIHQDDESAWLADPNGFTTQAKAVLRNFSTIRMLDLGEYNNCSVVTWADRKPVDYVYWAGKQYMPSEYQTAATTLISTGFANEYSVTKAGFVLADKARICFKVNASATGTNSDGANPWSVTIKVNGGSAITAYDETGATTPYWPWVAPRFVMAVYDAALNKWLCSGGGISNGAHINGIPPEIMVKMCNEVGAHLWIPQPYLAADPISDYMTQFANYWKANALPGLKFKAEGPNEEWNSATGFYATRYGWAREVARGYGNFGSHPWYGRIMVDLGAAITRVFDGDRTKYDVVCGVQTGSGTPSASDERLTSTRRRAETGSAPAKDYVTAVAITGYYNSAYYNTQQETDWAAEYPGATTQRKADIIASYMTGPTIPSLNSVRVLWRAWATGHGIVGLIEYEGGYSADRTGTTAVNNLRIASQSSSKLYQHTLDNYHGCIVAGGTEPSCYTLSGTSAWAHLYPTIYATSSPQYLGILAFNGGA